MSVRFALAMTRSGLSSCAGLTSKLTTGIVVGVFRLKYPAYISASRKRLTSSVPTDPPVTPKRGCWSP